MNLRRALAGITLALALTGTSHAGQTCDRRPPEAQAVTRGLALAARVEQHLRQGGAQVVLLARVGQDLSEYGQHYSHLGFAYRDGDLWRVAHKLNDCGTDHSAVYRQGIGEFFLDNPFDYEAGIAVPTAQVQARLLAVLRDNQRLGQMHTPAYSMVAYPWSQRYQQSNQWALETLAMAEEPAATDRVRAQAWLKLRGYEPAILRVPTFKRLGARVTSANVAFDDHPDGQRYRGRIATVTADSVFLWLARSGLAARPTAIR